MTPTPAIDRLLSRVVRTHGPLETECWISGYAVNKKGYAGMSLPGHKMKRCHRVAYEALVGPVPDGLVLDHLCRVRNCVNPAHLEPVTDYENIRRGFEAKGNGPYLTECKYGHEYTAENTLIINGKRACRSCKAIRQRRWYVSTRSPERARPALRGTGRVSAPAPPTGSST